MNYILLNQNASAGTFNAKPKLGDAVARTGVSALSHY
jgi:hypothetical protein